MVYSPRARKQLMDLYSWIAEQSGIPERAEGFVSSIIAFCDGLAQFPLIGVARDDLRPGLRTIGFRRRVVIAFAILGESVEIHGVYYGGRNYEGSMISEA
ncbi:type II toxin-antitoxin system RelE/ParE family toxin [Glutamicibacter sp. 287]|uniref:type II toxin-antitoxin system RelE/ParE family toxin n=1 Tax=unclassified Glutamicibacter TaxID=2627139 RepID=UPI0020D0B528|nr:type II toxin-antitoxin system RelE/ParE family toxin [Glutamicibacter sp. BW80]